MLVYEELTGEILGAAVEVHKSLGPGLHEPEWTKSRLLDEVNGGPTVGPKADRAH